MELPPLDVVALSKAANGATKDARNGIRPGEHAVDFMVRISGEVKVGEDYEQTPTVSIPLRKALALMAHVAGCTREAGMDKLERAMRLALESETDETAKNILSDLLPAIDDIERTIVAPMLQRLPKTTCKGKVTTKLTVEPLALVLT